MLIARYCKLFGLEPADQLGILKSETTMRMAINWACAVALFESENDDYQKAHKKGEMEAAEFARFLAEIEESSTTARK